MKKYSFKTRELREADNKIARFNEDLDVLITSEAFMEDFRGYVEDFARYKKVNGRKFSRSTDYAAIGIMTINDLYQEAYLAFLEAYSSYKDSKDSFDEGGAVWAYLKKTTILNFEKSLRKNKDGIRTPERVLFSGVNFNVITSIFGNLEEVFVNNVEEVALSKWETDLVGMFMDVHMDEYLDLTREGNRDFKKQERAILKSLYGLDTVKLSYKEVAETYNVSQSTIRKVKERAIKRLKVEESQEKIADFLHEYRISTQADTEKFRKKAIISDLSVTKE